MCGPDYSYSSRPVESDAERLQRKLQEAQQLVAHYQEKLASLQSSSN